LGVGTVVVVTGDRVVDVVEATVVVVARVVVGVVVVVVEAVVVVARVVVGEPAVVVGTVVVVVVAGTGWAATLTVDPRSTSTVPGATDGLTCIITAPDRYFIT
jgi:hypothetical protein